MGVVGIRFRAVEFSVYHFVHDDFLVRVFTMVTYYFVDTRNNAWFTCLFAF